jgi:hypothetical protein
MNVKYMLTSTKSNRVGLIRKLTSVSSPKNKILSQNYTSAQPSIKLRSMKPQTVALTSRSKYSRNNFAPSQTQTYDLQPRSSTALAHKSYISPRSPSESRLSHISTYRSLLRKEISIKDKIDEAQKLIEHLTNEEEKLEMSRQEFIVDKTKFQLYERQLEDDVCDIREEVKKLGKVKGEKEEKIAKLRMEIFEVKGQ